VVDFGGASILSGHPTHSGDENDSRKIYANRSRPSSEHGQQRVLVGFRLVGADVALVTVGIVFGTGLFIEDFISAAGRGWVRRFRPPTSPPVVF
jgi:hypothetical protein